MPATYILNVANPNLSYADDNTYIIRSGVAGTVGLKPANFSANNVNIVIDESNSNSFTIQLLPNGSRPEANVNFTVNPGVLAPDVTLDATLSNTSTINIGAGASISGIITSTDNGDSANIVIGDGATVGSITTGSDGGGTQTGGNDNITIGDGANVGPITLNAGNDTVVAGSGDEQIDAGDGADSIDSGAGDDTVDGGAGNDIIDAGSGADVVTGGAGDDQIALGASDGAADKLILGDGSGSDIVTGFEIANDTLDVSTITSGSGTGGAINTSDVSVSDDGSGNAVLTFAGGEVVTLIGVAPSELDSDAELQAIGIPCFAAGTMIQTTTGPASIEALRPGAMIQTRDHGPQPLRWIGMRRLDRAALSACPWLRPIRIRAGAMGRQAPCADLLVSPQHRVLVRSRIARRMFGAEEVLVAAKQLITLEGIDIANDLAEITYVHMLFDQHEIVISNGAETESLYPGPEALKTVGPAALEEILTLFPELRDCEALPQAARVLAPGRMGRKLAARHAQNGQLLLQ